MKFKLTFPVQGFVSQNFGGNATSFYNDNGLYGHPGTDIVSKYDDPIIDPIVGYNKKYIYSLLNKDNPDLMRYRAVCMIVEADDGVFEVITGHCNKITCQIGPLTGQELATEGNTGDVFVGSSKVTVEAKNAGSHAGFHVHFQVRRLKKVKQATMHSLTYDGQHDFVDPDGFHFDVPNYENGYNGCIDARQFIDQPSTYKFTRDLQYLNWGTDVLELQKRLIRLGFANFTPSYIFGPKTKAALIAYQQENGIDAVGRAGPITRNSLNS